MEKVRYLILFSLWTFGFSVTGMASSCLAIAILCMVRQPNANVTEGTMCGEGDLEWSATVQSALLSGYSYGGFATVFLAALILERLGAKSCLLAGLAAAFLCGLLIPYTAETSWLLVFILRVITGVAGGVIWPVTAKVVTVWLPPSEQAFGLGTVMSSLPLADCFMLLLGGELCCQFGWKSVFYSTSLICLLSLFVILVAFTNSPKECKWVKKREMMAIEAGNPLTLSDAKRLIIPWKEMIMCLPLYAIALCSFVERMYVYLSVKILPIYANHALKFDPGLAGVMVGLPLLARGIGWPIMGNISDKLRSSFNRPSLQAKCFNTTAFICVGATFIGMMYLNPENSQLLALCYTLQHFLGSFTVGGYLKSSIDIAPRFSSIIYGVSRTAAYMAEIAMPFIVQGLTRYFRKASQWSHDFELLIAACGLAALVYLFFGTSERQGWNSEEDEPHDTPYLQLDFPTDPIEKFAETIL